MVASSRPISSSSSSTQPGRAPTQVAAKLARIA